MRGPEADGPLRCGGMQYEYSRRIIFIPAKTQTVPRPASFDFVGGGGLRGCVIG